LQHDNTCGIYETRPQICRDYGLPGDDPCEYFTQDLEYDLFFTNDAELETWLAKKKNRKKA
jgi:Fe-S-cluster containining protein